MSNTKHTPGKWTFSVQDRTGMGAKAANPTDNKENSHWHYIEVEDKIIASTWSEPNYYNASLMAAAPEMLEALEGMVWLLEKQSSIYVVMPQFEKMVSVIKKAKGEQ